MKKTLILLLTVGIAVSCLAQDEYNNVSPVSKAYHRDRAYTTTPPYGLEKVKQLIRSKTVKGGDDNDDEGIDSLPERLYRALSFREKFTYNMIYGESFHQNCDIDLPTRDEEKKIFANLPPLFGEEDWSNRQMTFFKDNKDSVIALMSESIGRAKRVGLNYKYVIVDIDATSMIPLLISTYNLKKEDHDILTVLMLLMKNNAYPVFVQSISYNKLYAGKDKYYNGSLVFNQANESLILQRATDFYNGLVK